MKTSGVLPMALQIANPVEVAKVERLARSLGLTKTAVVEFAIDRLASEVSSASATGRMAAILEQIDRVPDRPDGYLGDRRDSVWRTRAEAFVRVLEETDKALISTVSVLEARMVVHGRRGQRAVVLVDDLSRLPVFEGVAPERLETDAAYAAFVAFGRDSGHSAGRNFGDLFG
jgi:hypothetical protein